MLVFIDGTGISEEKPVSEDTLENLIELSAEGARRSAAESLRQKDREWGIAYAVILLTPELPQ